jgi:hypothetical protein
MMRRSTGLDANEARRQLLKEGQHVPALQLTTKDHLTIRVNAMNLKDRLRDIDTDSRNRLHDLAPPNHECPNKTHIDGACRAGRGAVHSISCRHSPAQAVGSKPGPDYCTAKKNGPPARSTLDLLDTLASIAINGAGF